MAAGHRISSLSAGLLVYDILSNDQGVTDAVNKIFPVVSEEGAQLPYICYRRASAAIVSVKGSHGSDSIVMEVVCYSATYAGSIEIAEAVRTALDGINAEYEDADGDAIVARSSMLTDAEEGWDAGAYFQSLSFEIKINNV